MISMTDITSVSTNEYQLSPEKTMISLRKGVTALLIFLSLASAANAGDKIEKFMPRQGGETEVWRVTNDPLARNWANYQNTDAWSPDGRYICYESHAGNDASVHLFDVMRDRDILLDPGIQPRWANNENWLFYLRPSQDGSDRELVRYDTESGKKTLLCSGVTGIGETDADDHWIFGKNKYGILRIPISENARPEDISAGGALGSFMLPNPQHPVVMFRGDSRGADGKDIAYAATRVWSDLEGNGVVSASPMIQRCHQAWTGDGLYHMHGNSQLRGRRWDEPFPSNLHYLSRIFVNDPCVCGRNGRWTIGSGNVGPMPVIDLRSGDGHDFLKGLSWIHDSWTYSYSAGSGLHDNDAKGSPDGTKVVLSSNYDLKDSPVTSVTEDISDKDGDSISVESTDGFPASGLLSIKNEIIGYERKTATSFEGLTREVYNSMPVTGSLLEDYRPRRRAIHIDRTDNNIQLDALKPDTIKQYAKNLHYIASGDIVTSFDARLIPENMRDMERLSSRYKSPGRNGIGADMNSPLIWQRQTDVYIAVIRKPDRPWLAGFDDAIELIPAENHFEIRGYHIFCNFVCITKKPLPPGSTITLKKPGRYHAVAVEWSGLESDMSSQISVDGPAKLTVRANKPGDFQWTKKRWVVDSVTVSQTKALNSEWAHTMIVHRYDGVIGRETYNWGVLFRRVDLNYEGQPIRILEYRDGVLESRIFRHPKAYMVSKELFAPDGHITESVRYEKIDSKVREIGHWWFEKGLPVKLIGSEGHTLVSLPGVYTKAGQAWEWKAMPIIEK